VRVPDSPRAAQGFIGALLHAQRPFDAAARAEQAASRWPDHPGFPLVTTALACQVPEIRFPDLADLERRLATSRRSNAVVDAADSLLSLVETGHCPVGLPYAPSRLTGTALANPGVQPQRQNLLLLHSRALEVEGRHAEAREVFGQAIDTRPQMILLIQGILDAVTAGDLALARRYLERARSDPRIGWRDRWSHRNDLALLEELIRSREPAPAAPP
jgi:hypothetical protein